MSCTQYEKRSSSHLNSDSRNAFPHKCQRIGATMGKMIVEWRNEQLMVVVACCVLVTQALGVIVFFALEGVTPAVIAVSFFVIPNHTFVHAVVTFEHCWVIALSEFFWTVYRSNSSRVAAVFVARPDRLTLSANEWVPIVER
ncbi:MAG: hypothetical protein J3Q66DRAFT_363350 [Benniella sp.]|nr:MAG: hypothetical protein J3Q66DRAFT_363350 [Benniella sp.]